MFQHPLSTYLHGEKLNPLIAGRDFLKFFLCGQAARVSADAVAAAVTLTNDCIKDGNAVEATSKAAASAWRSSQVRYNFLLNTRCSAKDFHPTQCKGNDCVGPCCLVPCTMQISFCAVYKMGSCRAKLRCRIHCQDRCDQQNSGCL